MSFPERDKEDGRGREGSFHSPFKRGRSSNLRLRISVRPFWLRAEAQLCLPAAALSGGGSHAPASGPFPEKDSAEFCFSFKGLWFLVSALSSRAPLST